MAEPEVKESAGQAATASVTAAVPVPEVGKRSMAATIIGAHTLQHIYVNGFYAMVPTIYQQMALVPVQAGIIDAARWISSGSGGIFSGFVVDLYRHRRGFILGLSMLMLAGGYLLVSLAPGYAFIILALVFAHIGSAMWHPPGIGLLSEHFPARRGLLISLHRSSGSLGDTVGPVLVGVLLAVITWQQVLQFGFPVALLITVVVWLTMWNVGGAKPTADRVVHTKASQQFSQLKRATKGSGLITLMAVAALRGMGDRALLLFFPLYLSNTLGFDTVKVGIYLGLLTLLAIVSGPVVGAVSDRIGRKPLVVLALFVSAIFPPAMVLSGDSAGLTISVVLFGLFLYSVNSLVQAAAMDLVDGMKLEGTLVGLLWGNNAFFGAVSPVIAGVFVGWFGFQAAFWYAAIAYLIGGVLSLRVSLRRVGSA